MRYAFIFASLLAVGSTTSARQSPSPDSSERLSLGLRGVYFVPNQGQWSDGEVHYGLRSRGLDVAFRDSSLAMHMSREVNDVKSGREPGRVGPKVEALEDGPCELLTLTLTFPGSNDVQPQGADPQSARFNYFVGGEGRGSASNVPSFGAVIYENLYDGIDLHVTGNDGGILKYEFHVAPGADWSHIAIAYEGIDSLCIDDAGDLHINTTFGTLIDAAPLAWQGDAASGAIPARFELVDDHIYRIVLDGPVDPTREFVIDPDVEWMYYLGGSANEVAQAIQIGPDGNLLTAGETASADFEGKNNSYSGGATDAFLASMTQAGELAWMTYFGGSNEEHDLDFNLDESGTLYMCGTTLSNDLPGRNNSIHGLEDGFAARIDRSGLLSWTTYLGGSSADSCADIAISADGRLYITGSTESIDFEGRNNSTHDNHWHYGDAFLAVMDRTGALQWMTYLGGEGEDGGTSIAVGPSADLFLVGQTTSVDFEGQINNNIGFTDAFALRITGDGETLWMRYFGGAEDESGSEVVLDDRQEYLYIAGSTASAQFEGQINSHHGGDTYGDGYLLKVSIAGELSWMVFLGGSEADSAYSAAIDSDGQIIVVGSTASSNFEGRINDHHGGFGDAFVLARSPSGEVGEMVYLGGSDSERAQSCVADDFGRVYVSGSTKSPTFDASLNSNHGAMDAFVLRVATVDGPRLRVLTDCPSGGPIQAAWSDATPSAPAALIFARDAGSFTIPNNRPCPGTTLGLGAQQLQVAFTGNSDANGSRTLNATIGPAACGGYLQLLDAATCSTSNVARVE